MHIKKQKKEQESLLTFTVVLPVGAAQPAEVVSALRARHVHAALVLLDRTPAFRARLGVDQDPIQVLTLCCVLCDPPGR